MDQTSDQECRWMFPVPNVPQDKNPRSIFQCATRPDEITHLSCWLMNDVAKILEVGSTTKAWLCGYACHVLFWASKLAKCDKFCHHMLTMHQVSSRREPSHKFKTKEPTMKTYHSIQLMKKMRKSLGHRWISLMIMMTAKTVNWRYP